METTSIKRLYDILKEVHQVTVDVSAMALEGWEKVFRIPDGSEYADSVFLIYPEFIKLIKKAKEDIQSLEINHDLYLRYYSNIEKLTDIKSFYKQKWSYVTATITDHTLEHLEFCVDAMAQLPSEEAVPEDDLINLKNDVNKILDDVLEKNIEPNLKKVIVSLLEEINLAIIIYKINGVESFQKVWELSVGKLILNRDLIDGPGNEEEKSWLGNILQKIGELINIAVGTKELLQTVLPMLPAILPK